MKKLYTASLALILALYGCSSQPKISEFEGIITKKDDSGFVLAESVGGDIEKASLVSFSSAKLADNGAAVGDTVSVTFDGEIRESYPLQITAESWDLVFRSENSSLYISISAVTPEGCKVSFTNNRDTAYIFFGYGIEKRDSSGEWKLISDEYSNDESTWKVEPGCSTEIKLNWTKYCGELSKGEYRLIYQYFADGADKALLIHSEFML